MFSEFMSLITPQEFGKRVHIKQLKGTSVVNWTKLTDTCNCTRSVIASRHRDWVLYVIVMTSCWYGGDTSAAVAPSHSSSQQPRRQHRPYMDNNWVTGSLTRLLGWMLADFNLKWSHKVHSLSPQHASSPFFNTSHFLPVSSHAEPFSFRLASFSCLLSVFCLSHCPFFLCDCVYPPPAK